MSSLDTAISDCIATLESIRQLAPRVEAAAELVRASLTSGGKLLACGNGGSAADSAHFTTEFVCRFQADRRPYPAICFASEGSALTAIGNDYHFEEGFARQVRAFGKPEDVLVVFTSSGKSRNIARALEESRAIGMASIAFLGRDGGFTAGLATVDLLVPGTVTARIQEAHKLLLHVLCEQVEPALATG